MLPTVLDVLYALSLELRSLRFEAVDNLIQFLAILGCQLGLLVDQIRIHLTNIHQNGVRRGVRVEHVLLHFRAESVEYHLPANDFARMPPHKRP